MKKQPTPKPNLRKTTALKSVKPSGKQSESFFADVFSVVAQIPPGRVTSYGAIARCLGSGLSARMVGWALSSSITNKQVIPAQRVVNRNGQLSGKAHFGDPNRMQELLEKEGLTIKDDTVQNFDTVFWDPAKELFL